MIDGTVVNLLALVASIVAIISSGLLAWRALLASRQGNHSEVLRDFFKEHRSSDFMKKERNVWENLRGMDPALGFSKLPSPMREEATEVALFYLEMAYFSEYKIADRELIGLQVQYRLLETWKAIEAHVAGERDIRGGEYTFLNTLEAFVCRVRKLDSGAIARRMLGQV